MTLWFVFALMTAAAVFAVLWPLGHGTGSAREGSEAVVYKDQLAEIQRDAAAGMIGATEAEAARVEISRRLLAASDTETSAVSSSSLPFRRAVAVAVPVVATALDHGSWSASSSVHPPTSRGRCSREQTTRSGRW